MIAAQSLWDPTPGSRPKPRMYPKNYYIDKLSTFDIKISMTLNDIPEIDCNPKFPKSMFQFCLIDFGPDFRPDTSVQV